MTNRPMILVGRQKQTMIYMILSCLSLVLTLTPSVKCAYAFSTNHSTLSRFSSSTKADGYRVRRVQALMPLFLSQKNNSNDPNEKDNKTMDEKIDKILDTPFFDPDEILDNDANNGGNGRSDNPLTWFANLVKNDYETAEALYAGVFFGVMVILGQELLRMYMYGDGYIPFQGGKLPGSLF